MIRVEDLRVLRPGAEEGACLLDGVSFACASGSLTALCGASGSGKSSLLAIVAGLTAPAAGRVALMGRDLGALSDRQLTALRRKDLALIFQSYNLFPTLTALENAAYGLAGERRRERAFAALERLGLGARAEQYPNRLSGGEQQRVAVARALAREPRVLLADEPTAALDPANAAMILEALRTAAREAGAAVLMISHDPAMLKGADQILRIEGGGLEIELAQAAPQDRRLRHA